MAANKPGLGNQAGDEHSRHTELSRYLGLCTQAADEQSCQTELYTYLGFGTCFRRLNWRRAFLATELSRSLGSDTLT